MSENLYVLKIQLDNIKPPIWRRFVVPANITLDTLHEVIQIVMGWENYHLYAFSINGTHYTTEPEYAEDGLESSEFQLSDLIKENGSRFTYEYDFGDGWVHNIILEESSYPNTEEIKVPRCIKGKRACPPEDVGGIYGYYAFCEAMSDTKHEEHKSYLDWYGEIYDPDSFDINAINSEL